MELYAIPTAPSSPCHNCTAQDYASDRKRLCVTRGPRARARECGTLEKFAAEIFTTERALVRESRELH